MKLGTLHQILNPISHVTKIEIFEIQDGGGRHLDLKIAVLAITHRPIVRFQRNFVWGSRTACRQGLIDKISKFLKIQDDGRPPFWKLLNRHVSVENRPILMKFGTLQHILNSMTVLWTKIEIFKIQDGGGRHLENRFFGHNSSTDCPISAKFCVRKQNSMSTRATWQKLQIFKIQDGGRPPFSKKSLNRHISVNKNLAIANRSHTFHRGHLR